MTNAPMPGYNPDWSGQSAVAEPVKPKQITWAFQLILAAAALSLIAGIFGMISAFSSETRKEIEDTLAAQSGTVPPGSVDAAITIGVVVAAVMLVLTLAAYVVIGMFINKGHNWARLVGLILAVLSLSGLYGFSFPGSIFTILSILAGAFAIVLCYMKPGSSYFTDMKNFRMGNKLS